MFGPRTGLLGQFAQGGGHQVFALVDPALRHLPPVAFLVVDAAADEDLAVGVDQHDSDAGAVAEFVHVLSCLNLRAARASA